jgi:hypothetical protein
MDRRGFLLSLMASATVQKLLPAATVVSATETETISGEEGEGDPETPYCYMRCVRPCRPEGESIAFTDPGWTWQVSGDGVNWRDVNARERLSPALR